jgi:hypothetical protein
MNKFLLISKRIINEMPFIRKLLLLCYYRVIIKILLFYRIKRYGFFQKIDRKIDNKKLMSNVGGGHFLKRDYFSASLALGGINISIVFNYE